MQYADPRRVGDGIGAADGVKLLQQRCDMILCGMGRDAEAASDQFVRRPLCQQRKDIQLSGRQFNLCAALGQRGSHSDYKGVGLRGRADEVDTFDVGQSGRDPFCKRRITHIDRQSQ